MKNFWNLPMVFSFNNLRINIKVVFSKLWDHFSFLKSSVILHCNSWTMLRHIKDPSRVCSCLSSTFQNYYFTWSLNFIVYLKCLFSSSIFDKVLFILKVSSSKIVIFGCFRLQKSGIEKRLKRILSLIILLPWMGNMKINSN